MLNQIFITINLLLGSFSLVATAEDNIHELIVLKSPDCGCCGNWISHMESNGFSIVAINKTNMAEVKARYGIDRHLQSCHTAVNTATGYIFEGHIPAGAIKQFLSDSPKGSKGLTVPGMPAGSPGMEMGNRFDPYQIVQINKERSPSLFMNVATPSAQADIGFYHE